MQAGDVWIDSNSGNTYINTVATTQPGMVLVNSGTGAHSHSLITGGVTWANIGNIEPTYTLKINGKSVSIKEKELSALYGERDELKKLCEEQPAVQEAFERLQTLVKLYRE